MALKYGQQYYAGFKPAQLGEIGNLYKGTETALKMKMLDKDPIVKEVSGTPTTRINQEYLYKDLYDKQQDLIKKLHENGDMKSQEFQKYQAELIDVQKDINSLNSLEQAHAHAEEELYSVLQDINVNRASSQLNLVPSGNDYIMTLDDLFYGDVFVGDKMSNIVNNHSTLAKNKKGEYVYNAIQYPEYHKESPYSKELNEKQSILKGITNTYIEKNGILGFNYPQRSGITDEEYFYYTYDNTNNYEQINSFINNYNSQLSKGATHELADRAYKDIIGNLNTYQTNYYTSLEASKKDPKASVIKVIPDNLRIVPNLQNDKKFDEEVKKRNLENMKFEDDFYSNYTRLKELEFKNMNNTITDEEFEERNKLVYTVQEGMNTLANIKKAQIIGNDMNQVKSFKENLSLGRLSDGSGGRRGDDNYTTDLQLVTMNNAQHINNKEGILNLDEYGNIITIGKGQFGSYNLVGSDYNVGGKPLSENPFPLSATGGFIGGTNNNVTYINPLASNLLQIVDIGRIEDKIDPIKKEDGSYQWRELGEQILLAQDNFVGVRASLETALDSNIITSSDIDNYFKTSNSKLKGILKDKIINELYSIYSAQQGNEWMIEIEQIKNKYIEQLEIARKKQAKDPYNIELDNKIKEYNELIKKYDTKRIFTETVGKNINKLIVKDTKGDFKLKSREQLASENLGFTVSPYINATVRLYANDYDNNENIQLFLENTLGADEGWKIGSNNNPFKVNGTKYPKRKMEEGLRAGEYYWDIPLLIKATDVNLRGIRSNASDKKQQLNEERSNYNWLNNMF